VKDERPSHAQHPRPGSKPMYKATSPELEDAGFRVFLRTNASSIVEDKTKEGNFNEYAFNTWKKADHQTKNFWINRAMTEGAGREPFCPLSHPISAGDLNLCEKFNEDPNWTHMADIEIVRIVKQVGLATVAEGVGGLSPQASRALLNGYLMHCSCRTISHHDDASKQPPGQSGQEKDLKAEQLALLAKQEEAKKTKSS
jgi:hypothetical protein